MNRLFILGSERSGSTWVSNVLDAHPAVVLLMEPFAGYAKLLPEVPGRNTYLQSASDDLAAAVRRRWAALAPAKFPLLTAHRYPHAVRVAGRALIRAYARLHSPLWVRRYGLLNLNHMETPAGRWPRKAPQPLLEATKELRLNFKLSLLSRAFPESKIVVTIRHPFAQLDSIRRMFDRGHLGELQSSLPAFREALQGDARFEKYAALEPGDPTEELAAWWLVNYEVLLEDIDRSGLPALVVSNEELSDAPIEVAGRMLRFSGLPDDPAVSAYLRWSSTSSGSGGALDTRRQSKQYSRQTIERAAPAIRPALLTMAGRLPSVHPLLQAYLRG